MSKRSYTVGLPVGITVDDDGNVSISIDLSEAGLSVADAFEDGSDDLEDDNNLDPAIKESDVAYIEAVYAKGYRIAVGPTADSFGLTWY